MTLLRSKRHDRTEIGKFFNVISTKQKSQRQTMKWNFHQLREANDWTILSEYRSGNCILISLQNRRVSWMPICWSKNAKEKKNERYKGKKRKQKTNKTVYVNHIFFCLHHIKITKVKWNYEQNWMKTTNSIRANSQINTSDIFKLSFSKNWISTIRNSMQTFSPFFLKV